MNIINKLFLMFFHHSLYILGIIRPWQVALRLDTLHGIRITGWHLGEASVLLYPLHVLGKPLYISVQQHLSHEIEQGHPVLLVVREEQSQHLVLFVVIIEELFLVSQLAEFSPFRMGVHLVIPIQVSSCFLGPGTIEQTLSQYRQVLGCHGIIAINQITFGYAFGVSSTFLEVKDRLLDVKHVAQRFVHHTQMEEGFSGDFGTFDR